MRQNSSQYLVKLILGRTLKSSNLMLLTNRFNKNETLSYLYQNTNCVILTTRLDKINLCLISIKNIFLIIAN
jgi:hypothetical protein